MILQSMYSIFGKIRSFRKMYMLFSCLRAKQIKAAFWVMAEEVQTTKNEEKFHSWTNYTKKSKLFW